MWLAPLAAAAAVAAAWFSKPVSQWWLTSPPLNQVSSPCPQVHKSSFREVAPQHQCWPLGVYSPSCCATAAASDFPGRSWPTLGTQVPRLLTDWKQGNFFFPPALTQWIDEAASAPLFSQEPAVWCLLQLTALQKDEPFVKDATRKVRSHSLLRTHTRAAAAQTGPDPDWPVSGP